MPKPNQFLRNILYATTMAALFLPKMTVAQPRPPATVNIPATPAIPAEDSDPGSTQRNLMKLLEVSPNLASVLASDPSLLANQEYVSRSNPELAQFLQQHPEVARNPAFYLFSDLHGPGQKPYSVLQPKEGFVRHDHDQRPQLAIILDQAAPIFIMGFLSGALIWLIRLLLQNKRWKSIFALHNEVHARLIDRFGTSQELLTYMETEAGRRFLQAAPIATEFDQQRTPNIVSRILTSLQVGILLALLGTGLLSLRHAVADGESALLVLGVVILMPGVGCILSAGITWIVASRLGLMPSDSLQANDLKERQ